MRRNVRRLNREANDGQPNHKHVNRVELKPQHGPKIENISRGGRSRKAANLAELQRYFNAAAEAASEVLCNEPEKKFSHDFAKIAEAGIKPLDSPSRMVAVSLATGNIRFRKKLREKLEATGGVACKINTSRPDVISVAEDYDRQVAPMPKSRLEMSDGCQEKSINSAVKRKKMSLRVTIDEADNFGLASATSCFRSSSDTQISSKLIAPCQETHMASEAGNKESPLSVRHAFASDAQSRLSSTLFSDPLKFDFDEVVAHYP